MNNLLSEDIGDPLEGIGPLGTGPAQAGFKFSQVISSTIGIMTIVAIIWFLLTLIIGAIGIISAGGDKAALESARKKIVNAIIGLVALIASIFILTLIGYLIGLDMTQILSPATFLNNLWK